MLKKFIAGAGTLSVAALFVLAGCSGGSRLMPAGAPGTGMGAAGISFAVRAKASEIVYKGPKVAGKPEVDLYSKTPATSGYSATFTLTQQGSTKAFSYSFKPVSGLANNCPKTKKASYLISPASGKSAKKGKYTVKAASKAIAGGCLVTFTGASHDTLKLMLTFTTSGIVIGKPPSTK